MLFYICLYIKHIYKYTCHKLSWTQWCCFVFLMQLTASSEKMTIHSASGAGAKRQARDAAHIAGDWNAQDGAGSEGLWFKWKSAANFLLIKWWSIISFSWNGFIHLLEMKLIKYGRFTFHDFGCLLTLFRGRTWNPWYVWW